MSNFQATLHPIWSDHLDKVQRPQLDHRPTLSRFAAVNGKSCKLGTHVPDDCGGTTVYGDKFIVINPKTGDPHILK